MARHRLRVFATACGIVLVVAALAPSVVGAVAARAGRPASAAPVPAPRCFPQHPGQGCSPWHIVAGASLGSLSGSLNGVVAISADDVWAVGGTYDPTTHVGESLAEHWNGTSWSVIPTPNPNPISGYAYAYLNAVAATASNDVWAVGDYYTFDSPKTLIEHWDGTSWSIIPSPNPSALENILYSVAAISVDDAWAVGGDGTSSICPNSALTLHWDGHQWTTVCSAIVTNDSGDLQSVAAVSSTDMWAVGSWVLPNSGGRFQILIEHWNGSQWTISPTPTTNTSQSLSGVAVAGASNVWAAGDTSASLQTLALFEQWNGSQWAFVPGPSPNFACLNGIASEPGTSQLWAVGCTTAAPSSTYATFIAQYTPSAGWTQILSPNVSYGTLSNQLYGVAAVSANEAWAVGATGLGVGNYGTLILHYVNTGSPPPWHGATSPTGPSVGAATPGAKGTPRMAPARYWWRPRALR